MQVVVPKGGVVLRDNRCWHGASPNSTPLPRHMLMLMCASLLSESSTLAANYWGAGTVGAEGGEGSSRGPAPQKRSERPDLHLCLG